MQEEPLFFENPSAFRDWLNQHHANEEVLWVGYYKVATGKPSITWEESVREALCFGWIDGLRKTIDDERYRIRFSPRKPESNWSFKNIAMIEELLKQGRVSPAGLKVYEKRKKSKTGNASYERQKFKLKQEYEDQIKSNGTAWKFFRELAPGYTRQSVHWVMSAKREETRQRRLRILIESCEAGQKIPPLRYGGK